LAVKEEFYVAGMRAVVILSSV